MDGPHVTAYAMPSTDQASEDPLAYLDAYDSSYEEEPAEHSQYAQNEEGSYDNQWDTSLDMPEPEAKAEEDPYGQESDAPEYPDATEYPEIPKRSDNEYDWPTNGMAGPTAEEYWNPEMTGLEDNKPSSTMHDQMTSAEVIKWLQEPSDQVVFDRYNQPD